MDQRDYAAEDARIREMIREANEDPDHEAWIYAYAFPARPVRRRPIGGIVFTLLALMGVAILTVLILS